MRQRSDGALTFSVTVAPYAPGPHTLGRFIENSLNPDDPTPGPEPTDDLEPRRQFIEANAKFVSNLDV